jgi:hypothetical protein
MSNPFDSIPPYNPSVEKRKKPKEETVEVEGILIGTGDARQVVNPKDVWKLAAVGCTDAEIAQWWGIKEDTLRYNFADYIQKARSNLKQRLRHSQIQTALGGNPTMLIWLGKQYLGQSDTPQSDDNKPLPWTEDDE